MDKSLQPTLKFPQDKSVEEFIWIAGTEVDECSVSLQFWSDNLIPDEVTHFLGIHPTQSYQKGEIFERKGCEQIHTIGLWVYSVNKCACISLESHINALFDQLPADISIWSELTTRFEADLLFGLRLEQSSCVLDFSRPTLQRINERGLSISLDLYFDNDERELTDRLFM